MTQALIVANGQMDNPPKISSVLASSPLIIAVDGGIRNCKSLSLFPHVIIGDLDSIQPADLLYYKNAGIDVLQFPARKDETDLELALQYVAKKNVSDVIILGGLGARWDMTISNLLLLAHPHFINLNTRFLDGSQEILLLRPGIDHSIKGQPGDLLSLIPLSGDVVGVITGGLEYPLLDESLYFGTTRGVSNVFSLLEARISYKQGLLMCTVIRGEI